MALTLHELKAVSSKRNDIRWLKKRMSKRSGGDVSRSLAGSLVGASEEDLTTVSVFKSDVYGNASYLKRGSGRPGHLVGIQNFNHPRLRLLVWDDHAKAGQYFFSWDGGFVYTGFEPILPPSGCSGPLGTLQWIYREILASGLWDWTKRQLSRS
ncbi:MAG: hypothetical protein CM15mP6_1560 [Methanobacteriota archaeon]|nr:MAG: hypothetical protein CM15mP6_1560 [Euryarchaeota archaeon]